jgi:hypothetical protein
MKFIVYIIQHEPDFVILKKKKFAFIRNQHISSGSRHRCAATRRRLYEHHENPPPFPQHAGMDK